jgi:hypothetical protein
MATLPLTGEMFVDGVWTAYPLYSNEGWDLQIGPDVQSGIQPNNLHLTWNNDALTMDPTNPASALYGKIGRNTPTRLLISGTPLLHAEASSWKPTRTVEHQPGTGRGRSAMTVTAEGLLRRLGRWTDPIRSPMTRQVSSYASLTGYWPLEDPSGSTSLSQIVNKADAGRVTGTVSFANNGTQGGSDSLLTLGTDGGIGGSFLTSAVSGFQICWTTRLDALPTSATYANMFSWLDSLGRSWYWDINNTTFRLVVTDETGATLVTAPVSFGATDPTAWNRYRIKVTISGSTITYEPAWYPQDSLFVIGYTGTFTGPATGYPVTWRADGNAWTDGASYGHVFAVTDTSLDLTGGLDATRAFNGYVAERAGDRFVRLMGEEGLSYVLSGTASKSALMGRQKPGIFTDLLQEIVDTDAALLFDYPLSSASLELRLNNYLVNRASSLDLQRSDLVPPLDKLIDDVGVVNDITGQNADGLQYRAELTTGPLSTAVPPSGVGRYKGKLDVNLYTVGSSITFPNRVRWELANKTIDKPRYSAIVIDLLATPGFRTAVNGLRPGDVITLTGVEADTLYLRVITINRQGGAVQDEATLTCLPADVWLGGKYDDGVHRYDSKSTTLSGGVTSTATTLTLSTINYTDLWSQTSAYDVMIAGERIGIPAGGMSGPSGTGPWTQTVTGVTRSKNGIVKAQLSGAPVHTFNAGRASL